MVVEISLISTLTKLALVIRLPLQLLGQQSNDNMLLHVEVSLFVIFWFGNVAIFKFEHNINIKTAHSRNLLFTRVFDL